jgi:hypothetical protein
VAQDLAVQYNSFDLGAIYRIFQSARIGIMLKNIAGFSFREEYRGFSLPKYATLAMSYTIRQTTLSLDSESIFGRFGGPEKQSVDIWLLRGGLEHCFGSHLRIRAGFMVPAIAQSSSLGDLKTDMPWPRMGGSLGIGLVLERFDIDLALYGDPARSYVERGPVLGASGSLVFKF